MTRPKQKKNQSIFLINRPCNGNKRKRKIKTTELGQERYTAEQEAAPPVHASAFKKKIIVYIL